MTNKTKNRIKITINININKIQLIIDKYKIVKFILILVIIMCKIIK